MYGQTNRGPGYPPQGQPGYPPQGQPGYPPQGGQPGYPPQGGQPGYPPQQPPQQPPRPQPGYPPQGQPGYPPQGQPGYPPQGGQPGYPPQQGSQPGYPPQQGGQPGYPPQQGGQPGYPPQQPPQQPPRPQGWASGYAAQLSPQEYQQCQQWFQSVDRDRSGTVSVPELSQVQFNGRPIGAPVAAKLIKVFDKDQSGSVDLNEYCSLHKFLNIMQAAFFRADADRSGTIGANELYQALSSAGFQLSQQTVTAVTKKFDTTGRGLDFPTFLFVCGHLAHIRSIFEWNDQQRTNQITLNFDQFAHVGTDLLP
eukprot:TRINITY_DN1671_c0_g1_i4.p1 TRINITY_DN1671_c0_g1~~TRINITY_DN1671_c0_g1_i4.p1  ORF type:complete len:309 (-),score=113.63 TRINITY_DN1671_c0_g1_i4:73-999(-)